jgi:hypothetical protein
MAARELLPEPEEGAAPVVAGFQVSWLALG